MFAFVQFLVDKIKATVPLKNIKDFNLELYEAEAFQPYEVFWKSENGAGTGYYYAVILLVEDTEELIEQRKKRVRLPSSKKLEELLMETLGEEKKRSGIAFDKEMSRKNKKKIRETQTSLETEKLKLILKRKLGEKKSTPKVRKETISEDEEPSEDDELILKSEFKRLKVEHGKVLKRLQLKQEENCHLKKRNEELLSLNMKLQTQLLKSLTEKDKFKMDSPSVEKLEEEGMTFLQKFDKTVKSPPPKQKVQELDNLFVEKLKAAERGILPAQPILSFSVEDRRVDEVSERGILPAEPEISFNMEDKRVDRVSERGSTPVPELSENKDPFYLHNENGNLMKWQDNQIELAPQISIKREQWQKIMSGKGMCESKVTRNLSVALWGSETLKERSVTGKPCKRFKKSTDEAKPALTPVKVDAIQNGVRFWLSEQGKSQEDIRKLASSSLIRKYLSDKIMDVSRKSKKSETIQNL